MQFVDAEPIPSTGSGRKAEPNPYTDVIVAIALKTKNDKPVAKAFTLTHEADEDSRKKAVARVKRQLSEAGADNDPPVTVPVRDAEVSPTETRITFWTVTRQTRPRKEASTETPTVNA